MLLFFYDSGDHPHLHSFPTRRSSDLAIGSRVLVRVFEHRLEIRDLKTQALLRSHERVERPGSVVLPMEERVFNPSRQTRRILGQAQAIGADAQRLCELLFAIEGRVGQRKLWGIVALA